MKNYTAVKCLKCGKINLFPFNMADGCNCVSCRGYTVPIGDAVISGRIFRNMSNKQAEVTIPIQYPLLIIRTPLMNDHDRELLRQSIMHQMRDGVVTIHGRHDISVISEDGSVTKL
ncbi:hypothetical protein ACS3UN_09990 [Oscillospiraceae bacterium LTW-04]|nr:hypothetical protein RBH76_11740 [Oscillospiraceae bacterium MB24-C1]